MTNQLPDLRNIGSIAGQDAHAVATRRGYINDDFISIDHATHAVDLALTSVGATSITDLTQDEKITAVMDWMDGYRDGYAAT